MYWAAVGLMPQQRQSPSFQTTEVFGMRYLYGWSTGRPVKCSSP